MVNGKGVYFVKVPCVECACGEEKHRDNGCCNNENGGSNMENEQKSLLLRYMEAIKRGNKEEAQKLIQEAEQRGIDMK